ncbi:MAG: NAD-dependent epimerase/dehydratase family protein [Candidatus Korobacteraceae bacterium]
MRVVIIGGTGHIGTYLTPRLVEAGHAVLCASRGQSKPYREHGAWKQVSMVAADRTAEEARGNFGERIAALQPEAVIDLTCYEPESAIQLVDALRGRVQHFLHCGTIWVHGPGVQVPITEEEPRRPFGEYGCRKATIEKYLLDQARGHGFPATVLHPGHIVGPGWVPLNPAGNFNPQIYSDLAAGRELLLPNLGLETVHHVHADDVAQGFLRALARRSVTLGESFHLVSPAALTLRGYAERMAQWYGQPANLRYLPFEEWRKHVSEKDAGKTWDHIAHSPSISIEKARTLLGYSPRYTSLEAVQESVAWLVQNGQV